MSAEQGKARGEISKKRLPRSSRIYTASFICPLHTATAPKQVPLLLPRPLQPTFDSGVRCISPLHEPPPLPSISPLLSLGPRLPPPTLRVLEHTLNVPASGPLHMPLPLPGSSSPCCSHGSPLASFRSPLNLPRALSSPVTLHPRSIHISPRLSRPEAALFVSCGLSLPPEMEASWGWELCSVQD